MKVPLIEEEVLNLYEQKFKALSDKNRLRIIYELNQRGKVCVCDLTDMLELPQSKLSYHLKMLLDANLILMERVGKWNYYELNDEEIKGLLSEKLCCVFYPSTNN
ncbi:ArsR/SmtB family transcription factor [Paenibacillus lutrae]|uniref:Metalloregulator ArsR/SmtB family transcription factor n=1 Tax=Paenibacillus lutrae TaxID=2078573 RepID=A0A7X3FEP0_9BACL|nr:metalloregulator ArsR/SmtB family transcription factor [Paenibacillus lutrae]MVO98240.1 metalloregulator ArsR/SmtB family transcription factor [Paenibacillus lutrae]